MEDYTHLPVTQRIHMSLSSKAGQATTLYRFQNILCINWIIQYGQGFDTVNGTGEGGMTSFPNGPYSLGRQSGQ